MSDQTTSEQEHEQEVRELRVATDRVAELHQQNLRGAETRLKLDVRDRAQKDFVERRLRFAGKTPENSPNLFSRLDRKSNAAKPSAGPANLGPEEDCTTPLSITQNPNNRELWEARIITSCFAGADYSYIDLFWWNTQTGQLLAYDFREDFNDTTDLTLEIEGTAGQIGSIIQVDSMAINMQGIDESFSYDGIIQERPTTFAALDEIFMPKDLNGDGLVTSCLDRGGADCDYYYQNTGGNIMLPINAKFRFPGTVGQIVNAQAQIHMTNSGGVCKTIDLAPYASHTAGVVTLDTNGAISFGPRCVGNQVFVRFWIMLVVRMSTGKAYAMYWANDKSVDAKHFNMQFRWSCLAEGSKIVMADGTEKAIEDVQIGERVRSGERGQSLTVVDVTSGLESAPIVEMESEDGGALKITQGHPFFAADGTPLRADELQLGTELRTSRGTTKVTKLARTPYAGKVYNLKLGTDQQISGLDVGGIHMFANGFSVGDSRSQWALEMARLQQAKAPVTDEWKVDHLMHQARALLAPGR